MSATGGGTCSFELVRLNEVDTPQCINPKFPHYDLVVWNDLLELFQKPLIAKVIFYVFESPNEQKRSDFPPRFPHIPMHVEVLPEEYEANFTQCFG